MVLAALAMLVGPVFQAQAPAEPAAKTFRSAANLVTIQASVRDHRGRPMTGLTQADFEIKDNDQSKAIVSLRADIRSPVTIAILVDMSGSMSVGPKIAMARRAFEALLAQFREGQDEVALFTFDSSLHQRSPFGTGVARVRRGLDEFMPFGQTSLYDATAGTARAIASRSGAHKAIIVLTDGIDTSSTLTAQQVSGLASSIDVPVYIVATAPVIDQAAIMESASADAPLQGAGLRNLADWTGGQLVFANNAAETLTIAAKLIDELRQQYVIAIEAASSPEWHRLQVRVKPPRAVVRARSGYYGG